MPLYFFHFHGNDPYVDHEGVNLPDLAAARVMAIDVAHETLRFEDDHRSEKKPWRLEVTNSAGHVVLKLKFDME